MPQPPIVTRTFKVKSAVAYFNSLKFFKERTLMEPTAVSMTLDRMHALRQELSGRFLRWRGRTLIMGGLHVIINDNMRGDEVEFAAFTDDDDAAPQEA